MEAPSCIRILEVLMEREQQRRENLQPAAREGHTVLLCPDQRHGDGMSEH